MWPSPSHQFLQPSPAVILQSLALPPPVDPCRPIALPKWKGSQSRFGMTMSSITNSPISAHPVQRPAKPGLCTGRRGIWTVYTAHLQNCFEKNCLHTFGAIACENAILHTFGANRGFLCSFTRVRCEFQFYMHFTCGGAIPATLKNLHSNRAIFSFRDQVAHQMCKSVFSLSFYTQCVQYLDLCELLTRVVQYCVSNVPLHSVRAMWCFITSFARPASKVWFLLTTLHERWANLRF